MKGQYLGRHVYTHVAVCLHFGVKSFLLFLIFGNRLRIASITTETILDRISAVALASQIFLFPR